MTLRPLGQRESPALIASRILAAQLGDRAGDYVFVDYCSGGGGPTPLIERHINAQRSGDSEKQPQQQQVDANGPDRARTRSSAKKSATASNKGQQSLVHFVLTDLHPHIPNWALASSRSPQVHHAPFSVDASASPPDLLSCVNPPLPSSSSAAPQKIFRTFHLAFHHLPDPLASAVLHDTLTTSHGLAIVELQDRSARSLLAVVLLGLGVLFFAPYYAWRWRSPGTLFWSWVVPVLPFVLVWDGWMSGVRTRTPDEIEAMMRTCGAPAEVVDAWEVKSGRITHLPPFADINWIIATKRDG